MRGRVNNSELCAGRPTAEPVERNLALQNVLDPGFDLYPCAFQYERAFDGCAVLYSPLHIMPVKDFSLAVALQWPHRPSGVETADPLIGTSITSRCLNLLHTANIIPESARLFAFILIRNTRVTADLFCSLTFKLPSPRQKCRCQSVITDCAFCLF